MLLATSLISSLALMGGTMAAPTARDVNGIEHAPTTDWVCGSALFTTGDIITTQKYAVEIQNKTPPQFHGRKDKNYPYGRFPHQFINNPSPPSMEFPAYCDDEANRKEYPMVNPAQESPYKGSINNNVNWGKHRLLYIHKIGDTHSIFCGLMTHEDQPRGTFDYCTPRR